MSYTFDDNLFSDLYKDAYGFRPRQHDYFWSDDETKQEIWDRTLQHLEETVEREKDLEAKNVAEFKSWVDGVVNNFADGNREVALSWVLQAYDVEEAQDIEMFLYDEGVLLTDFGQSLLLDLLGVWNKEQQVECV